MNHYIKCPRCNVDIVDDAFACNLCIDDFSGWQQGEVVGSGFFVLELENGYVVMRRGKDGDHLSLVGSWVPVDGKSIKYKRWCVIPNA